MNCSFPWEHDLPYYELDKLVRGNATIVGIDRCYVIYRACQYALSLPGGGHAAEVGVYKGGTGFLIGQIFKERKVYLFDTFAGLPAVTDGVDYHHAGDFDDVNFEAVKQLCSAPCFEIRKGFFPATAEGIDAPFAFVHLDADLYQTTLDGLNFFWPKLVPGGLIILDDFYWNQCPGVAKAVIEFSAAAGACPIPLPNCTGIIIKPPQPSLTS
jgi:O-methyltransferase